MQLSIGLAELTCPHNATIFIQGGSYPQLRGELPHPWCLTRSLAHSSTAATLVVVGVTSGTLHLCVCVSCLLCAHFRIFTFYGFHRNSIQVNTQEKTTLLILELKCQSLTEVKHTLNRRNTLRTLMFYWNH